MKWQNIDSTEQRMALVREFISIVESQHTLPCVLDAIECASNQILQGSRITIWLWDDDKQVVCRLLPRGGLGISGLPIVLDSKSQLAEILQKPDTGTMASIAPDLSGELGVSFNPHQSVFFAAHLGTLPLLFLISPPDLDQTSWNAFQRLTTGLGLLALESLNRGRVESEKTVLARLSLLAQTSSSRQTFLDESVVALRDCLQAHGCSIFLAQEAPNRLALAASTGILGAKTKKPIYYVEYFPGEGLTGTIWKNDRMVRLLDVSSLEELHQTFGPSRPQICTKSAESGGTLDPNRSFLGSPITIGAVNSPDRRVLGVVRVHRSSEIGPFLPTDASLLQLACEVLAPAIARWDATNEMIHEAALQRSLSAIIQAVYDANYPDTGSILETITEQARRLFNAHTSTLLLKLPDEDKLRVECEAAEHKERHLNAIVPFETGLAGFAARNRTTKVASDVTQDPDYLTVMSEVRSEMFTPIIYDDECLGVIGLNSTEVSFFRPDDKRTIDVLETFAKQTAIALNRAKLIGEREQWRNHMVRTTQLITATSIASGLAHELKNGLLAISTLAQKLEPDPAIKLKADNPVRLKDIKAEALKMSQLAVRLMDLSRVGVPTKKPVFLNELISGRLRLLQAFVSPKGLKIVPVLDSNLAKPAVGKGHPVLVDENQIEQVLTNLVLNAVDASHSGQRIEILTSDISATRASFSVRDFGAGIPNEIKGKIFDMFFTTKPHGFGIGLPVLKILVEENHGGRVEIDTKPGRGTTFEILLPKYIF